MANLYNPRLNTVKKQLSSPAFLHYSVAPHPHVITQENFQLAPPFEKPRKFVFQQDIRVEGSKTKLLQQSL